MDEHPTTGRSPCHVDLAEIVFISKTSEISTQLKHPHSSEEGLSAKMNIQPTVTCSQCNKFLAVMTEESIAPSCEELLAAGAVPVTNFGWFCSQSCADAFERDKGVRFQRNPAGEVSYY